MLLLLANSLTPPFGIIVSFELLFSASAQMKQLEVGASHGLSADSLTLLLATSSLKLSLIPVSPQLSLFSMEAQMKQAGLLAVKYYGCNGLSEATDCYYNASDSTILPQQTGSTQN
ncbi:hypothetical protein JOM56_015094 [Amanita muscaria]